MYSIEKIENVVSIKIISFCNLGYTFLITFDYWPQNIFMGKK